MEQVFECDVAIIGGGLGGVAAALAALEAGMQVVLTEPTDWIGGQVTSQAVSALDEHQYIESFGGTRSYYRFREAVRAYYRRHYNGPDAMPDGSPLNPGNGWVSKLCFEPRVGLQVLEEMLAPHALSGRLQVLLNHTPIHARVANAMIHSVGLQALDGSQVTVKASVFLDATETGDLLPLARVPYVTGAEAAEDTGEPNASREGPRPERVQSFTWCFFVEHRPNENHTIRKPPGYERLRDEQPFTLTLRTREEKPRRFYMFDGDLPFWAYRRAFDAGLFRHSRSERRSIYDIALINWDSNDFYKEGFIDRSAAQQARVFQEARRLSLSFLYWLQTEAPRDDNGKERGYPGLRLARDAAGTADGLAKAPYIREARRVAGRRRILEQDMIAQPNLGARALHYIDSVGIGWYPIDLHRCVGDPTRGQETRPNFDASLPFQIPLGAMLSPVLCNLIMAAKNIATTHITNGAYRLHPVEWNIGEAAGTLAAYCQQEKASPNQVWEDGGRMRQYQAALLARGVALFWSVDLGLDDPDFSKLQSMMIDSSIPKGSARYDRLQILPDEPLSHHETRWLLNCQPKSEQNPRVKRVLASWEAEPGLLRSDEFRLALEALGISPGLWSDFPTLRQVTRLLVTQ